MKHSHELSQLMALLKSFLIFLNKIEVKIPSLIKALENICFVPYQETDSDKL